MSLIRASPSEELKLLGRPELGPTFSKINLFALTQYDQVLYLDADTLPVQRVADLLDTYSVEESQILAAPDCGWPDIFNSGVFVIKPSQDTFDDLLSIVRTSKKPSFDGADQGLLNEYFTVRPDKEWLRLPFVYNVTPSGGYEYLPAYKFFADDVKLIHYIGATKPWDCDRWDSIAMRGRWWSKYAEFFHDKPPLESIHGIVPYYFEPVVEPVYVEEAPVEPAFEEPYLEQAVPDEDHYQPETEYHPYEETKEILLNPESYQYFDTVPIVESWDPAHSEPPKHGKPEAQNFPDLHMVNLWSNDATWDEPSEFTYEEDNEEPWEEPLPPPLFPWEFEPREKAERVFDPSLGPNNWDDIPLIQRIKELQLEEANKSQSETGTAVEKNEDEIERLREIEERYTGDIADDVAEDAIEDGFLDVIKQEDEDEEALLDELEKAKNVVLTPQVPTSVEQALDKLDALVQSNKRYTDDIKDDIAEDAIEEGVLDVIEDETAAEEKLIEEDEKLKT